MALWSADPVLAPGIRRRPPGWPLAAARAAAGETAEAARDRRQAGERVLAGQASTQAPPERVSPCRSSVRKLIAAHRLCSQASFLAVPM